MTLEILPAENGEPLSVLPQDLLSTAYDILYGNPLGSTEVEAVVCVRMRVEAGEPRVVSTTVTSLTLVLPAPVLRVVS